MQNRISWKKCPNCNRRDQSDDAMFCIRCGTRLVAQEIEEQDETVSSKECEGIAGKYKNVISEKILIAITTIVCAMMMGILGIRPDVGAYWISTGDMVLLGVYVVGIVLAIVVHATLLANLIAKTHDCVKLLEKVPLHFQLIAIIEVSVVELLQFGAMVSIPGLDGYIPDAIALLCFPPAVMGIVTLIGFVTVLLLVLILRSGDSPGSGSYSSASSRGSDKNASVVGRAVVGGLLAGPAGAVVGAISAFDKNRRRK